MTSSLIDRMRRQFLTMALNRWVVITEQIREGKIAAAGPLIAHACRGFLYRKRYEAKKLAKQQAIEREMKV